MIHYIIFFLFITLAAAGKAVADTLWHHYYSSIFRNYNEKYWNPQVSWKYVKFIPLTKYRPDAWHIANSVMIFAFVAAAVYFRNVRDDIGFIWAFVIIGGLFNLIFNFFYNIILRK